MITLPCSAIGEVNKNVPESGGPATQSLAGVWQGSLKLGPGIELRLVFEITADDRGAFKGTMISLDQGTTRSPFSRIVEQADNVHMEINQSGTFDGKKNSDASKLTGKWNKVD
jgi:hypothetical protein